jgi:hypothetical protein
MEAERLGGLEVDRQLVLGRRLHRQVGRVLALVAVSGVIIEGEPILQMLPMCSLPISDRGYQDITY